MRERIQQIMDNEQLTPSAFADILQIGRAVMSHILNGRNNPSLEVVTRILSKLPYIDPEWLIKGEGNMYKSEMKIRDQINGQTLDNPHDLFSVDSINYPNVPDKMNNQQENIVKELEHVSDKSIKQEVITKKSPERKVAKIIIYYTDNTFETFEANQNPLLF